MAIEKIETLLRELKSRVKSGDVYYSHNFVKQQFSELIRESVPLLPDKSQKLQDLKKKTLARHYGPYGSDILQVCALIEEFLDLKKEKDLRESKSFLGPADLIKKAILALRQGQDAYVIYLCDAAVEAFLKEVFDVPSTIVGAGTVKFLSECMILDIPHEMSLYLQEVKNKVSQIDNQIKHKAYVPSRLDAINALKAVEELYARRHRFYTLTYEEKIKVQNGIGLLKK